MTSVENNNDFCRGVFNNSASVKIYLIRNSGMSKSNPLPAATVLPFDSSIILWVFRTPYSSASAQPHAGCRMPNFSVVANLWKIKLFKSSIFEKLNQSKKCSRMKKLLIQRWDVWISNEIKDGMPLSPSVKACRSLPAARNFIAVGKERTAVIISTCLSPKCASFCLTSQHLGMFGSWIC